MEEILSNLGKAERQRWSFSDHIQTHQHDEARTFQESGWGQLAFKPTTSPAYSYELEVR